VAGFRLAAFPLAATLCGLGLALAGCGGSFPAASRTASAPVTVTASGNPACPSAAAVTAASGTAYLPPTARTASGALNCSYEANAGLLLIAFQKATLPVSELQQVADDLAESQGA
jgi:hypothetical protein